MMIREKKIRFWFIITLETLLLFATVDSKSVNADEDGDSLDCSFSSFSTFADCSNRNLLEVPLNLPSTVIYLKLNGNRIKAIKTTLSEVFPNLQFLDLSHNELEIVQKKELTHLIYLQNLLLNDNPLKYVEENAFGFLPSLAEMNMENTSLSCDCSAIWLAEWLRNPDSHSLLEFDRITCYQEYSKTYLKVVDVDSKALKPGTNCHFGSGRQRRSDGSTPLLYWSCHTQKVVPLFTQSLSTSDISVCKDLCASGNQQFAVVIGTSCFCGTPQSSAYNTGSGCTLKCNKAGPKKGCSVFTEIDSSQLSEADTQSKLTKSYSLIIESASELPLQSSITSSASNQKMLLASVAYQNSSKQPLIVQSAFSNGYQSDISAQESLFGTISTRIVETLSIDFLASILSSETSVVSTLLSIQNVSPEPSTSNTIESVVMATPKISSAFSASQESFSSSFVNAISMNVSISYSVKSIALPTPSTSESMSNSSSQVEISKGNFVQAQNSSLLYRFAAGLSTVSISQPVMDLEATTPTTAVSHREPTKYASPRTSYIPTTSFAAPYTALTQSANSIPEVITSGHRTKRALTMSSSVPNTFTSTTVRATENALIFTNSSSTFSNLTIKITVASNTAQGIEYVINGNNITVLNSTLSFIGSESIAVPMNESVDISLFFTDQQEDLVAQSIYNGIRANLSVSNCSFCDPRASAGQVFEVDASLNSTQLDEGSFEVHFYSDGGLTSTLLINFTFLEIMVEAPYLLSPVQNYYPTFEKLFFAFLSPYRHVTSFWTLVHASDGSAVSEIESKCAQDCQTLSKSACASFQSVNCFLPITFTLTESREYIIKVNFSNPVTSEPLNRSLQFKAERRITDLHISPYCDFTANIDMLKQINASFIGDAHFVEWKVDGKVVQYNSSGIMHASSIIGRYNVSVHVQNNINSESRSIVIGVIEEGAIHGLTIKNPITNSFHATYSNVTFEALLCEGESPRLEWSFESTSNYTLNSTRVYYTFSRPDLYVVNVRAENSKSVVETARVYIYVQDKIDAFNASVSQSVLRVNEVFRIHVEVSKGTNVTYDVTSLELSNNEFKGSVSRDLRIVTFGEKNLTVTARNMVSRATLSIQVRVEEPIALLLLDKHYLSLDKVSYFNVTKISGSHMSIKWDFGDGRNTSLAYFGSFLPLPRHRYLREGNYTVSLYAENTVSPNVTVSSLIFVERALNSESNEFIVTTKKYVATNSNFRVTMIVNQTSIYGYRVSCEVFSNVSLVDPCSAYSWPLLLTANVRHLSFMFQSAGAHKMHFTASNNVSRLAQTITVKSEIMITGDVIVRPVYVPLSITQYARLNASVLGSDPVFTWRFQSGLTLTGTHVNFNFTALGPVLVNVTAENNVSTKTTQVEIQVELQLHDLRLIANTSHAALNRPVLIESSIKYRREHSYTWLIDGTVMESKQDNIIHKFHKLGSHFVALNLANHISSQSANVIIAVEDPVSGIQVFLKNNLTAVPFNESVIVQAKTDTGSNLTYRWRFGSSDLVSTNTFQDIKVTQSSHFHIAVTVEVFNNVSKEMVTKQFPVVQRIGNVKILTSSDNVLVNNIVSFRIQIDSGSNISVAWRLGDKVLSSNFTLNYTFPSPGVYVIEALVKNMVGLKNDVKTIHVYDRIAFNGLAPNIAITNRPTKFVLEKIDSANVSILWFIPANVNSSIFVGLVANLTFPEPGVYLLRIYGKNPVHDANHTFPITVQNRVAGLEIMHREDFYRVHEQARFTAKTLDGTNTSFAWVLLSKSRRIIAMKSGLLFEHTFPDPGVYEVVVNGSNRVSSAVESATVYVQEPAHVVSITPKGKQILPTTILTTLNVQANGTNTSVSFTWLGNVTHVKTLKSSLKFKVDMPGRVIITVFATNLVSNNSKEVLLYFQEKVRNLTMWASAQRIPEGSYIDFRVFAKSGSHITYQWFENNTLIGNERNSTLRRYFPRRGAYFIKVIVRNEVSDSEKGMLVSVEPMTCKPPQVTIAGRKRREFWNSSWLYSEASIISDCPRWSVNSKWLVKIANAGSDCLVDIDALVSYQLPSSVDLTSPLLAVQPRSFKNRYYCLFYTARYGIAGKFVIYDALFLKVLPSPPIPIITGGELRVFGQNQSFALDGSRSIDPDSSSGQAIGFFYRWECSFEVQNSSSNQNHSGCKNTTWSRNAKLDILAGSLGQENVYAFTLFVKRLDSSPVTSSQKVQILAASRHDVFFTCITCQSYKTRKYIRNRDLKFLGECSDCQGGSSSISVTWSVTSSNGTTVMHTAMRNTELPSLFIIKKDTLDGIGNYVIKFAVITAVGSNMMEGESLMVLLANEPPSNGTCTVQPQAGVTLETKFWFSCRDWQDMDNSDAPFVNWVRVQNTDGTWATLYRGIQSNISMYLPVGRTYKQRDVRLQVLVEDTFGAIAIGLDRTVKVSPPDVDDIGVFLEDSVLSNINSLTEENDLNKVVAVSLSSAALISDSGRVGRMEENVVSNLTQSVSSMGVSSLENVDQVSSTLKIATGLVSEKSIHPLTREKLTRSLNDMINRVSEFSSQGQLAYQSTLEALLFLLQNNIAGGAGQSSARRKRRYVSPQTSSQVRQSLSMAMTLYTSILKASIPGEAAFNVSDKYGAVYLKRANSALISQIFAGDGCSFALNHTLGSYKDVFQIFNTTHVDPYTASADVKTKISSLNFLHPNGTEISVRSLPLNKSILIELDGSDSRKNLKGIETKIVPAMGKVEGELSVNVSDVSNSSLFIEILLNNGSMDELLVFHSTKRVALDEELFSLINVSSNGNLMKYFPPGEFKTSERHYIKIRNKGKHEDMNVTVLVYTVSCIFWDRENGVWSSEGLVLNPKTTYQKTVCRSSHLTSFASTFKIAPNPIKWSTLSEIDVEKNPIAISMCLAIIVVYLMSLFFASRKDEEDRREAQYIPLMGPDEYFKYEVRLKTGAFPGAGTSANVGIQIFATKYTTKPIVLAREGSFHRNSVELFRFSSPTRLGKILRIRIWHDNSGSSPSWYLTRVVIKNLLNGQKYFFFCNRWLGVDRDDGEIERVFRVADAKTMAKFKTIFNDVVGRTFTDYHLWVSIFEKPRLSRFTRVQRLTCCVTFLLSWMCVDAMWYGTVREGNIDVYIGLKGYSYEEVLVGVISSLMVFPINFLLVLVFRNCRLPKSRRVLDGDEEVTIHVLPSSQRTRRLSEDWIEIEDFTESPRSFFATSLPRCGGYFRLSVYQPLLNQSEGLRSMAIETLSDHYEEGSEDSIHSEDGYEKAVVTYGQQPNRFHQEQNRVSDSASVGMEDSIAARLLGRSSRQYKRVPVSYDENYGTDHPRFHATHQRPSSCGASTVSTLQTRLTTISSRKMSTVEAYDSMGCISSGISDIKEGRIKQYRGDQTMKKYSESRDANDSFSSGRHSTSRITSSSTTRISFPFPKNLEDIDEDFVSQKIPDIRELHPNLECLLPAWFVVVGYFGCLAISIFSFIIILIYGQQFGKDKALSWLSSIFAGLFQDVFITYPILLVLVAMLIALLRKPMNLDYGDFVSCPVVPGDSSATSKPVRGYALEVAQKQGRGKREIRRIAKNLVFQLMHLWIVFSICLTGYEPNRWIVKNNFDTGLASKNKGVHSIKSINELWDWAETELPSFLFPTNGVNRNWILRSTARMRQVRIHSSDCPVSFAVEAANMSKSCNLEYNSHRTETANFLPRWLSSKMSKSVKSPWNFVPESSMNGTKFFGQLGLYPHSGYGISLGKSKVYFIKKAQGLRAAGWLDVRTRAVFIEFVMQNININRYLVTTIAFEISASGMILPTLEMIYLRVHMYVSRLDYFRLFCEVIFGLLTFYFLWLIQDKLRRNGCEFFKKFWNLHLLLSFAASGAVVGLSIYRLIRFLDLRPFLKAGVPQGYDLRYEAIIDWSIQSCMGFVCFLLVLKIISLLTWTRAYRLTAATLRRGAKHLLALSAGLVLVLVAFASWAYLAFGSNCYFFHSFWNAFMHTFLLRNVHRKDIDPVVRESGAFIAWGILYRFALFAIVFGLFKAAICSHYKDGRILYAMGNKKYLKDFLKHLYNKLSWRKKKSGKRVKFSLNPSVRRNTLAMSQQTISLGSDQWLSAHSLRSYSHIPSYYKERIMSRLTPSTDEILNYVYQLEHDEILEDEFYSRLESLAIETRSKRICR